MSPDDYDALRGFFAYFATVHLDRGDAVAKLEAMERDAPKRAATGLRLAVQDCLELSARLSVTEVCAADDALSARGLPTLSQMRVSHWRRVQTVVARGAIRTEAERAAIRALIGGAPPPELLSLCLHWLEAFEARRARRLSPKQSEII